jgi:O-antigen/teichoic acid export membrane protein
MRAAFKATAILGSSSVLSVAVGIASAKILATYLGPDGIGRYAVLQGTLLVISMLCDLGLTTSIVRQGGAALKRSPTEAHRVWQASTLIVWTASLAAGILFLCAPGALAAVTRGAFTGRDSLWFIAAIGFLTATNAKTAILNAHHLVSRLARWNVLNSLVGAVVLSTFVLRFSAEGIAPGLAASSACKWVVVSLMLPGTRAGFSGMFSAETWAMVKSLIAFGVPITVSNFAGRGVQELMPTLVSSVLGTAAAGFFQATVNITTGAMGIILAAMAQDYYPRVAATDDRNKHLQFANEQHTMVLLLATPCICALQATSELLMPLLYSDQFGPTAQLLRWQLSADLLRVSSWTMGILVLSQKGSWAYLFTELVAGISLFALVSVCVRPFGLNGVGVAYLLSYAIYWFVAFFVLRRTMSFSWTPENWKWLGASLTLCLIGPFLALVLHGALLTVVLLVVAVMVAATYGWTLRLKLKLPGV